MFFYSHFLTCDRRISSLINREREEYLSNTYSDIHTGSFFRNHKGILENPDSIRIVLFFDECRIQGNINYMNVYMSLENINFSDRNENIAFLASIPSSYFMNYENMNQFLWNYIKELIEFEKGKEIIINDKNTMVYAYLMFIVCDHKGAHELSNFKTNFNNYDLDVFNISGKLIKSFKKSTESTVNVSDLESGLYFFKFTVDAKPIVKKVIKL